MLPKRLSRKDASKLADCVRRVSAAQLHIDADGWFATDTSAPPSPEDAALAEILESGGFRTRPLTGAEFQRLCDLIALANVILVDSQDQKWDPEVQELGIMLRRLTEKNANSTAADSARG